MKVNLYLNFPGTCAEALALYARHLGAQTQMQATYEEMAAHGGPLNVPAGLTSKSILHARFKIGDALLMASDGPPERVQPMRSAYITLSVNSNDEAQRIYDALTEGGEIFMPLEETFFAHRFGQFRDKFGINWMLIHEKTAPEQD